MMAYNSSVSDISCGSNCSLPPDVDTEDNYSLGDRALQILLSPYRMIGICLALLVITCNILSLAAILNVHGKLTSHFRFILSLACSDIFVGVSVLLHVINSVVNPTTVRGEGSVYSRNVSWCSYVVFKSLNTTGLIITLLNLMGMSFDAYLAVLRPSYYISLKCYRNASCIVACLWVIAILGGFSDFIVSGYIFNHRLTTNKYTYCEIVFMSKYQEEYSVFVIAFLCLVTMMYLYCRIYFAVKHRHRPGESSGQRSHGQNRSKRILLTTVVILITFVICWLPLCILNISLIIHTKVLGSNLQPGRVKYLLQLEQYLYDLLLLHGFFDPVIYTIRIPEVQQSYKSACCRKKKRNARFNTNSSCRATQTQEVEESALMA